MNFYPIKIGLSCDVRRQDIVHPNYVTSFIISLQGNLSKGYTISAVFINISENM